MKRPERPTKVFGVGLQAERTALAWERTAIATMVSGVVLTRFAAADAAVVFASIGLLQTVFGAALLVWAGWHYDDLHGPLSRGTDVIHPFAARAVGLTTLLFTVLALALTIGVVIAG